MDYIIASDSSSNLRKLAGAEYTSVPLKILTNEKEYVDDAGLDVRAMLDELAAYKGRSGTACPSVGEWLDAFSNAENVFAVTITSGLSGSYNACVQAKKIYEQEHPGRRVCCLDSLSTGPEMALIAEKLHDLIRAGLKFAEIERRIREYMKHTHLLFMLESVDNLAKNGRISLLAAKAVGVLSLRIVGKASNEGTLQSLQKVRGEKRGLRALLRELEEHHCKAGRIRIAHCFNEQAAAEVRDRIVEQYPEVDISITPFTGLCSFYGEQGCVMVGFEDVGA